MKKRLLAIALSVVMGLAMLPTVASAKYFGPEWAEVTELFGMLTNFPPEELKPGILIHNLDNMSKEVLDVVVGTQNVLLVTGIDLQDNTYSDSGDYYALLVPAGQLSDFTVFAIFGDCMEFVPGEVTLIYEDGVVEYATCMNFSDGELALLEKRDVDPDMMVEVFMHIRFVNGKQPEYGSAYFSYNLGDTEVVSWRESNYSGTSMESDESVLTVEINGEYVTLDTGANSDKGILPYSPPASRQYQEGSIWEYFAVVNDQGGNTAFLLRDDKSGVDTTMPSTVDTPSSWAAAEVSAAIAAGLVPENLQRNYTSTVSRGNVAQMFVNLIEAVSGEEIEAFLATKGVTINESAFTDTKDSAVLASNALGIINGVGEGRFDPNGTFTRAQIAAIINRVANVLGVETRGYRHDFTDLAGHWADSELGWPLHAGIVNGVGDGRFDPDSALTTEQAIAIAYRALLSLSAE